MDKPPLLLAILLLVGAYVLMPLKIDSSPISERLVIIQGNSLASISNPNYIRPITQVLACIIDMESGGNPNAYNGNDPNGGSCGCLQFQKPTFQEFCIDTYGLSNDVEDVWDCPISLMCADMMISDGLGYHWTTYDRCY